MNAIYDLLEEPQLYGGLTADYIDKMMHPIPEIEVVSREQFILGRAKDKVVLDVGCFGPMGNELSKIAGEYYGFDKTPTAGAENYHQVDIDKVDRLPILGIQRLDLIIAGEVIEHLSNAGHFLDLLHQYDCPVILTTPNAHSAAGYKYISQGIECVNGEHVAYYSYHTLKILVERHGFSITEWYWYNGKPGTAEGLIFCLE